MRMLIQDLQAARQRWWLFLVLGAVLIVLGLFAFSAPALFTDLTVMFVGWLFLFGGAGHVVAAFSNRIGSGFFLHLLSGLLDTILGLLMIAAPGVMAGPITVFLGLLFLLGGFIRAGMAVYLQHPSWGLSLLSGILGVILGIFILIDWQETRVWVIGLLVGIELLSRGISWVVISLALRRFQAPA